ncbi:F-box/kelch-repeat protein At3g06240-like [Henckelia pumila]|uniref:F-box/kelch-repeat protein At3g06240-like n=1 Tax=Henckelia pumila TaxID=405737 RepID=UPI003C6E520D
MADPHLPEDAVIEILIRLPVKSIVKLRCVSKTWRDLIKSPTFIHRHQNRERKQSVLLVKRYLTQQNGDEAILSFHDPDSPELLVSPNLSIPFSNDLDHPSANYALVQIYGPCNGIVCIPVGDIILLCNPALREFMPLPPPNIPRPEGYFVYHLEFGFGFDPNTGAYKVMQISQTTTKDFQLLPDQDRFDLYDSASNSWKHIDAKRPIMITCFPSFQIFFGGVLHFYAEIDMNDDPYILCFDITTEAFQLLDFPDDFPEYGLSSLTVLNENLAMVGYPRWKGESEPSQIIEIWVMKEYGVKESWTKQFVIGPYMVFCPFLLLNNEWLLVESNNVGQLAVCGLHENNFKELQFYGFGSTISAAVVYQESLISLNDII